VQVFLYARILTITVITHSDAKDHVGSKDRVENDGRTDEWTEAIALPPVLMRSVNKGQTYERTPDRSIVVVVVVTRMT